MSLARADDKERTRCWVVVLLYPKETQERSAGCVSCSGLW